MNGRSRIWYILMALTLGLIGGYFLQEYVSSQAQPVVQETVSVVVAGANLSLGSILRPQDLRVVQWPRQILPWQTSKTVKEVEGRQLIVPIMKGEPILLPQLVPAGNPLKEQMHRVLSLGATVINSASVVIKDWVWLASELSKVGDTLLAKMRS
jgi:Flp pilus assembly protein CpaB